MGLRKRYEPPLLGYELSIGVSAGLFVMPEGEMHSHVFITGGIGVTPYRSILRHATDIKNPINVIMLYFNHSAANIVFRQELDEIALQMPTFRLVHVLSEPEPGWAGEKEKLGEVLLRKWVPDPEKRLFWVSGPPALVAAYRDLIKHIGVPDEAIRADNFIGY